MSNPLNFDSQRRVLGASLTCEGVVSCGLGGQLHLLIEGAASTLFIVASLFVFTCARSLLIAAFFLMPPSAHAEQHIGRSFVSSDLGISFLGQVGAREQLSRSYALGVRGGYRWGSWGAFGVIEPAYWSSKLPTGGKELIGALNIGIGGEYLYAKRFVRTAVSAGTSTLIRAGELDERGDTGFFFELRPSGLRWQLGEKWRIGFDPILFSLMVPVLDGIPLIEIEYRSTLSGEFIF